jgi:hypothetical protein
MTLLSTKKVPFLSYFFLIIKYLIRDDPIFTFFEFLYAVAGDGDTAVDRLTYFKVAMLEMDLCGSQEESSNFMKVPLYSQVLTLLTKKHLTCWCGFRY